jgi:hypothetical protein
MPANARAILIEALRDAHRWLDALLSDPRLTLESIASSCESSLQSAPMAPLVPSVSCLADERTSAMAYLARTGALSEASKWRSALAEIDEFLAEDRSNAEAYATRASTRCT